MARFWQKNSPACASVVRTLARKQGRVAQRVRITASLKTSRVACGLPSHAQKLCASPQRFADEPARKAKFAFLQTVKIFAKLSSRQISRVADVADSVTFAADEVIIAQGDEADSMYLIEEGQAVVSQKQQEGGGAAALLLLL